MKETEFCGDEDAAVNAEVDTGQIDEKAALKGFEFSKPESVQTSENLFIDLANENEVAGTIQAVDMTAATGGDNERNSVEVIDLYLPSSENDKSVSDASLERSVEDSGKAVETRTTSGANDCINCVEVIDLCSSPSKVDKPISDVTLGKSVEDMIPVGPVSREKRRRRRKKKKRVNTAKDNAEVDIGQIDEKEALKVVEFTKPESVQTSENLSTDPAKENEVAGAVETVQMRKATGGDNERNSVEVIDLCLSSSEDDKSVSDASLERSVEDSGKAVQTRTTTGGNDCINCVEVIDLCSSPSKVDKPFSDVTLGKSVEDMIPVGPVYRENKRRRRRKKKERVNTAKDNAEVDIGQIDEKEALKVVEFSKPESVQTSENLSTDPAKENEVAGAVETVQMRKATGGDNERNSVEVIDLCLPSSEDVKSVSDASLERSVEDSGKAVQTSTTTEGNDRIDCVEVIDLCSSPSKVDKPISDVTLGKSVEDMIPVGPVSRENKRRRRKKKKRVNTAKDNAEDAKEENDAKYNVVLRMLLRKPRYFDPLDRNFETCLNCGKENHTAASCKVRKKKKPCFLCASFKHSWKNCTQGQECFIGRATERPVNDYLHTHQGNNFVSNICLRCRDSGHDMFSCGRDYLANDLKEIQCYVCKSFGHLCCVNFSNIDLNQVSCYNCGQSGHSGPECTLSREAPAGMKSNVICYKCGKEGHFARICGGHFKKRPRLGDLLSTD